MTVLSIILGVLMIMCGISCTFTPLATFVGTGYVIAVLILVYGIMGLVSAIVRKEYGVNFLFAIISIIAGLLIALIPDLQVFTDGVLLYLVAGWFILQGLVTIFLALNAKRVLRGRRWILGVIIGIIGVILGVYSCFRPFVLAVTIGIMIGVYFIVTGINMIIIAVNTK